MDFKSLLSKIDNLQEDRSKTTGSFEKMQKSVADRSASDVLKPASTSKSKDKSSKGPNFDTSELSGVLGGKLPKEKPGTVSRVHKTPDFEPDDDDGSEIVREMERSKDPYPTGPSPRPAPPPGSGAKPPPNAPPKKNPFKDAKLVESGDPITQLAMISDKALDDVYHYGRSSPGNTFGWQANMKSAEFAKRVIDAGVTDIEKISDAIHKGWNVTARAFVQNPDQFDDTEKLRAAGKLEAKLAQREKLMNIQYAQLPEEEKEKDRVVARALLDALKGNQQNVAEMAQDSLRSQLSQNAVSTWKVGDVAMYRGKRVIVKDPNYDGRILVHEPWQSDNERGGVYSPASPDQLQRVTEDDTPSGPKVRAHHSERSPDDREGRIEPNLFEQHPRNLKEWMNRVEGISEDTNTMIIPATSGKTNVATGNAGTAVLQFQGQPDSTLKLGLDKALKDGKLVVSVNQGQQSSGGTSTTSTQKPAQSASSTGMGTSASTAQPVAEEEIDEVAAPGQEEWIKKNKDRFVKQYGKKKGMSVLYATAWKRSKGKNESMNESKTPVMESYTLEDICQRFPHESKMLEEGWGLDENLYEALADHYHREGRIPYKVWHGPLEELRDHVTKCYMEDTGMLMDESVETASSGDSHFGPLEEVAPLGVIGGVVGGALARSAAGALGVTSNLGTTALSAAGRVGGHMAGNALTDMISDHQDESLYELEDLDDLSSEEDIDDVEDFPFPDDTEDEDSMSIDDMKDMKQDDLLDEEDYMMEAKKKNVKNKHTKVLESEHYLGRDNLDITDDFDEWSTVADGFRARIVPAPNGVKAFGPNGLIGFFDNKKQKGWIVSDIDKMDDDENVVTNKYGAGDPLGAKFPDPDLLESKKKKLNKKLSEETKETKSGRVHKAEPGGYGRRDDEDDEGKKVKKDKDAPKRGRGRPKKDADSETGEVKKWDTDTLARWIVGSKPEKLPGKASVKHKIKDESAHKKSKKDPQMESWDRELKALLNEGMTITTSTGQPGGMDSVSVSATDSDAQTLLRLLQDAGIGLGGKSSAMSHGDSDGQSISVEPVAHDEVMGQLTPQDDGGDDALGFIKRMLGARGSDSMDSMEMDYESEADHDHAEHDHDDDEEVKEGNKFTGELAKARADGVQSGEKMKVDGKEYPVKHGKKMDEEDEHDSDEDDEDEEDHDDEDKEKVDESQLDEVVRGEFTQFGNAAYDPQKTSPQTPQQRDDLASQIRSNRATNRANSASALPRVNTERQPGESAYDYKRRVDFEREQVRRGAASASARSDTGATNPVRARYAFNTFNEEQQSCNECGGSMYEGHQCETEELNEWANSPMGRSADEDFKTEIEYMTRLISGGLNGQKRDQTTLPHTKVKTEIVKEDISATMRKLAGIK